MLAAGLLSATSGQGGLAFFCVRRQGLELLVQLTPFLGEHEKAAKIRRGMG